MDSQYKNIKGNNKIAVEVIVNKLQEIGHSLSNEQKKDFLRKINTILDSYSASRDILLNITTNLLIRFQYDYDVHQQKALRIVLIITNIEGNSILYKMFTSSDHEREYVHNQLDDLFDKINKQLKPVRHKLMSTDDVKTCREKLISNEIVTKTTRGGLIYDQTQISQNNIEAWGVHKLYSDLLVHYILAKNHIFIKTDNFSRSTGMFSSRRIAFSERNIEFEGIVRIKNQIGDEYDEFFPKLEKFYRDTTKNYKFVFYITENDIDDFINKVQPLSEFINQNSLNRIIYVEPINYIITKFFP